MNSKNMVIRNLEDAGCTSGFIRDFMVKFNKNSKNDELRLLEIHRRSLLDTLHREQKKIDCLDYLIYQIRKGVMMDGQEKN